MQALSIYIIIRLDEGQTEHNNFDSVIITLVKVSRSANLLSVFHFSLIMTKL
jgi:hypothetical protein